MDLCHATYWTLINPRIHDAIHRWKSCMIGINFKKTSISPVTICVSIRAMIRVDDWTISLDGFIELLTKLNQIKTERMVIRIPRMVWAYLKGPNISRRNWDSTMGLSLRIISNPPRISVPNTTYANSDNDIRANKKFIFCG